MERFLEISSDEPLFQKECSSLSLNITCGKFTLTQLVEDLRIFLIDDAPSGREKGTRILSSVLEELPDDLLCSKQLGFICTFYTDRLNEHHQVIPQVLKGLIPLAKSKNIPDGAVTKLLSALFQHVSCQLQQQLDRYNIYVFFKTVLDKRKEEVKVMGLDFVYGVISAIDGERDPRNILFLFNWLPYFLKIVELGHLNDEMFDVMACYFPVDFRSTAQEPDGISRETLSIALRPCLCAVSAFSDNCLQLILEKLPTELQIAKSDSLDLLIESCDAFLASSYVKHSTELWSLLVKEVFNGDKEIKMKSSLALSKFLGKLSQTDSFVPILRDIIDSIKGNLLPDTKLFEVSSKILISVAEASKKCADFIMKDVLALLINLYLLTETVQNKIAVFRLLVCVTKVYLNYDDSSIDDFDELKTIPNLCLAAVVEQECNVQVAGLDSFVLLVRHIPIEVRNSFYKYLMELLVSPRMQNARASLLRCFKTFARNYPDEVEDLLQKIAHNGLESLRLYLEVVGVVVSLEKFTTFAVEILFSCAVGDVESARVALKILRKLLGEEEQKICSLLGCEVIRLVEWFLNVRKDLNPKNDCELMDDFATILNCIVGNLKDQSFVGQLIERIPKDENCVVVLYGLTCRLKNNVSLDLDVLCKVALCCECFYMSNLSAQLLANIINKSDEIELQGRIDFIKHKCAEIDVLDFKLCHCLGNLVAFVTKALVVRGHPFGDDWTNILVQLAERNIAVAKGFQIIMDDSYDCLSSTSHCNRTLLYRQKFFVRVTATLSIAEGNDSHLLIFGHLMSKVPENVLKIQLKKIIKLVIACLEKCQNVEILRAVLTTLCKLIENKDAVVEDYVGEFVMRFLTLATFEESMHVRILALKGIQMATESCPVYKLLPLKQEVISDLGRCLDDTKRLVRKEAVEARSKWFLLDAPI